MPSFTRIAPTAGFGRLSGRPRMARLAAAASQRVSSSVVVRMLCLPRRVRFLACLFAGGLFGGLVLGDLAFHFVGVDPGRLAEFAVEALADLFLLRLQLAQFVLLLLVLDVRADDLFVAPAGLEGR